MANFIGQEIYTSKLNQTLSAPPAGIAEFFSALNIFLSITAAVGNALILIALKNVFSIHPPTKLFFRCLAVTDLCVGLIVQPLFATYFILLTINMNENVLYHVFQINGALTVTLCGLSVASSTAISVDRLLALSLGLRYRRVVTLRRARFVLTCVWLITPPFGWLWVKRIDIALKAATVGLTLCLVTSIFCYAGIHLKLRPQQAKVQSNVPHGQGDSTKHSKIQKNSLQHYVGAVGISCLLSSVGHCGFARCEWNTTRRGFVCCNISSRLKLISKPVPVLLENQRSETSS